MFPMKKCNRTDPCNFRTLGGNCFLTVCANPNQVTKKAKNERAGHIRDTTKKMQKDGPRAERENKHA